MGATKQRFGQRIRLLRQARNLTQDELADRAGLSVDAVRRIERGALSPSLNTIEKLASGLKLSLQTMFAAVERDERNHAAEICDFLDTRSPQEVRWAKGVIYALMPLRSKL